MRMMAFLLALAGVACAQDIGIGIEFRVGWDGNCPPGYAAWSVQERQAHELRLTQARQELTAYVEECHAQQPQAELRADVTFDLFRRSVNSGFDFEASLDLAKAMAHENVTVRDAEITMKTVATEASEAEAHPAAAPVGGDDPVAHAVGSDPDPNTARAAGAPGAGSLLDKEDHRNLGQWVKEQVHNGLHGTALAQAIHAKIAERKEAKKKEKEARKQKKDDEKDKKKDEKDKKKDDKKDNPGHGHGKGKDKD